MCGIMTIVGHLCTPRLLVITRLGRTHFMAWLEEQLPHLRLDALCLTRLQASSLITRIRGGKSINLQQQERKLSHWEIHLVT